MVLGNVPCSVFHLQTAFFDFKFTFLLILYNLVKFSDILWFEGFIFLNLVISLGFAFSLGFTTEKSWLDEKFQKVPRGIEKNHLPLGKKLDFKPFWVNIFHITYVLYIWWSLLIYLVIIKYSFSDHFAYLFVYLSDC